MFVFGLQCTSINTTALFPYAPADQIPNPFFTRSSLLWPTNRALFSIISALLPPFPPCAAWFSNLQAQNEFALSLCRPGFRLDLFYGTCKWGKQLRRPYLYHVLIFSYLFFFNFKVSFVFREHELILEFGDRAGNRETLAFGVFSPQSALYYTRNRELQRSLTYAWKVWGWPGKFIEQLRSYGYVVRKGNS